MLNSFFGRVLKHSLSAHLTRVKLLLFTFYPNGGLPAVSIWKPSERMSNLWTVRFFKTESEQNFGFPHIPSYLDARTRSWPRSVTVPCMWAFT